LTQIKKIRDERTYKKKLFSGNSIYSGSLKRLNRLSRYITKAGP
jgi:hypothetical protein